MRKKIESRLPLDFFYFGRRLSYFGLFFMRKKSKADSRKPTAIGFFFASAVGFRNSACFYEKKIDSRKPLAESRLPLAFFTSAVGFRNSACFYEKKIDSRKPLAESRLPLDFFTSAVGCRTSACFYEKKEAESRLPIADSHQ